MKCDIRRNREADAERIGNPIDDNMKDNRAERR